MKFLLVLGAAATLSGCRFWYKPVPVANAIGEERTVLAGDTVNVHREDRFEVYGPDAEAVYDGYEQLNRAYRAFQHYFGVRPAKIAMVLSVDSAHHVDSATARSFRERGFELIRYARPPRFKSPSRYGAPGYGGVVWPVAPTAARTLLARFVDEQTERDGEHRSSMLLDRLPLWFRAAVIHLVGDASSPATDLDYVRDKRSTLLPMRDVLTMVRPVSGDSVLDPVRRDEADEPTRLVIAQSATIGRFLIETEGVDVLGRMARGYISGKSITDIVGEFTKAPHNVVELERRWKTWIDRREEE